MKNPVMASLQIQAEIFRTSLRLYEEFVRDCETFRETPEDANLPEVENFRRAGDWQKHILPPHHKIIYHRQNGKSAYGKRSSDIDRGEDKVDSV